MKPTTVLALTILCAGVTAEVRAASCERVATLRLANTTVTSAAEVAAGAFAAPGVPVGAGPRSFGDLPAFCRVAATLKPSSDSDIKIEVWLPARGWNGKFQAVGNGAFSGIDRLPGDGRRRSRRGYAASSTDTGHAGGSASFALGHPEKVIDFGWRAVHEMTVAAKAIIAAYYGARAAVLVLERLLGRRPPGDEGGADVPGRLRRHHRRRAGPRLDRPRGAGGARRAGCSQKPRRALPPATAASSCTRGGRRRATRSTA